MLRILQHFNAIALKDTHLFNGDTGKLDEMSCLKTDNDENCITYLPSNEP